MNNKKVKITVIAILISLGLYGLYYKANDNIKRMEKLDSSITEIEERVEEIKESLEKIEEAIEKNYGKKLSLEA